MAGARAAGQVEAEVGPARSDRESSDQEERSQRFGAARVRPRRWLLVVVALLAVVGWTGWVRGIGPLGAGSAFARAGVGGGGIQMPGGAGQVATFGLGSGRISGVSVRSAEVVLAEGSAPVASTVAVCRAPEGPDTIGVGVVTGDLGPWCSSVVPIAGQDLGDVAPDDTIVVSVVALTGGQVRLTGVDVAYVQGGRHRHERLDLDVQVG